MQTAAAALLLQSDKWQEHMKNLLRAAKPGDALLLRQQQTQLAPADGARGCGSISRACTICEAHLYCITWARRIPANKYDNGRITATMYVIGAPYWIISKAFHVWDKKLKHRKSCRGVVDP
jgi:hypothetical protein